MDDLVAWLRAQLDEREQHARKDLWCVERATNGGDWRIAFGRNLPYSMITADGDEIGRLTAMPDGPVPDGAELPHNADAMLVGRMVKAAKARAEQTLREVEAKRRILDAYEHLLRERKEHPGDLAQAGALLQMVAVIKLLALPCADRAGYREEWRP